MLPVTALYASLLALWIVCLASRVISLRAQFKVGLLDGGHSELMRAIRVHGNACEYIPISLILLALAESQHLSTAWLHFAGCLLIIARLFHANGLKRTSGASRGRLYGMIFTITVILLLSCYNIYSFILSRLI